MIKHKKEAKVLIISLTVAPSGKYNAQHFMLDNINKLNKKKYGNDKSVS